MNVLELNLALDREARARWPAQSASIFSREIALAAVRDSFPKLDPRLQLKNPVMFIVELGSVITTGIFFLDLARGHTGSLWFVGVIAVWLWLTVLFANFAEAIAEGRGKAQANALRATRTTTTAHRRLDDGALEDVPAPELQRGDIVVVVGRRDHPGRRRDHRGRRLGRRVGDHRRVGAGDPRGRRRPLGRHRRHAAALRPARDPGHAGAGQVVPRPDDRARRGRRAAQDAERDRAQHPARRSDDHVPRRRRHAAARSRSTPARRLSQTVLIALLVALIPTTIGALLSAIGIAGMDRLVQRNVLAMSGRAVEASGDVDVLLLDKTGTITLGNRQASEFVPVDGVAAARARRGRPARLARRRDAGGPLDRRPREGAATACAAASSREHEATFIPFSADDADERRRLRRQAVPQGRRRRRQALGRGAGRPGARRSSTRTVDTIARAGGTPLVVAQDNFVLGVIHLKDIVKGGMRERFDELRRMGIRTVMITGDNRVTAAVIAEEAGVDDFLAEATPGGEDGADQGGAGEGPAWSR